MSACFTIRKGYKSAVVYHFNSIGEVTGVVTITPNKGMNKAERYEAIKKGMSCCKLTTPPFNEKQ